MISDPPADGTVSSSDSLHLPAPTASPVVLALGITLLFAGLVTSMGVSILGGILCVVGAVGWFRDVLPQEALESVVIQQAAPKIETTRHAVGRLRAEIPEVTRAWLPLEIYPVSAGIKGGLAGSVPMAVLAMLYGLIAQRSVWYPINLLVAGFFPGAVHETTAQLAQFHAMALIIAIPLHLITSVMVGLLYGALLPMFPRRPILLGGLFAPIAWSALLFATLDIINPVLNRRINWFWFVLSQLGFGLVAGIVVSRQERIRTWQGLPFNFRAGMEAPGVMPEKREEH